MSELDKELFIYNWEVISENPIRVIGHGLDKENKYDYIQIKDYKAFCYNTGGSEYLPTSTDLSIDKPFTKQYSKYKDELRGHMGEIPVLPMFTASTGLEYTGWVNTKTRKCIDNNTHPCPLILSFDIEVSSTDKTMVMPYKEDNRIEVICCIVQRYNSEEINKYVIFLGDEELEYENIIRCKHEVEMIDSFFELINKLNPDMIIGFNIYGFDFDFMVGKLQYYLHYTKMCSRPFQKHLEIEETDWQSSAYGFNKYSKVKISGRIIFDLLLYFRRFKLEKYSLNVISKEFLNEEKEDMSYSEMFDCFEKRVNLNEVVSYCIQDCLLVLKLFNKFSVWNELCETSKIMRCTIEDIYTRGEQHKVTNQMIKECIDRKVVLVIKEKEEAKDFEGATVLDPVKGIHDNCAVLDFQSLYPSIVIAFNICPSTINCKKTNIIGLFPKCIQHLLTERKKVKAEMKNISDPILKIVFDKRQNALKICANSMYGTMGFASNKYFGSIECAEKVTRIGRNTLVQTIDYIKSNFPEVDIIYGDTDSCMIKDLNNTDKDKFIKLCHNIAKEVTERLPEPMALNFEEYYKKMILMSKKRYIMVKEDNSLKFKGVLIARRGYCAFVKRVYKEVLTKIAWGETKEEIQKYIDKEIINIATNKIPFSELVMTKSVKDLNQYTSEVPQYIMGLRLQKSGVEVIPGTRLEYIFVENDSKKQGDKMYTPEEIKNGNHKIDYKYYILKQLANPVDELLNLLGDNNNYVTNWFCPE